jgi:hypothetical protein
LTQEMKTAFASVSIYLCPSRRSGTKYVDYTGDPNTEGGGAAAGPQIDYAMVFHAILQDGWPHGWMFCASQEPDRTTDYSNHVGPFRLGLVTVPPGAQPPQYSTPWWIDWQNVKPRDSFAWLQDGTSNQFMIGEKHIPTVVLDTCGDGPIRPSGWDVKEVYSADCSYLSPGIWGINAFGRAFLTWGGQLTMAKGPKDFTSTASVGYVPTHHYNFGSSHPGTVNFVLGDGAVRGVSVTTPYSVLAAFANTKDGVAVSLP